MYEIVFTNKMKRDVKRMKKRGKDLSRLTGILSKLSAGVPLDRSNHDHQLSGNFSDFRECHIEPDWLLLYKIENEELLLIASGTGTHSDLFNE